MNQLLDRELRTMFNDWPYDENHQEFHNKEAYKRNRILLRQESRFIKDEAIGPDFILIHLL